MCRKILGITKAGIFLLKKKKKFRSEERDELKDYVRKDRKRLKRVTPRVAPVVSP